MKFLLLVIVLGAVFFASLFIGSQNGQLVDFNYLLAKGQFPLSALLALAMVVGFVLGLSVRLTSQLRLRLRQRRLNKQLRQLQQQLHQRPSSTNEIA